MIGIPDEQQPTVHESRREPIMGVCLPGGLFTDRVVWGPRWLRQVMFQQIQNKVPLVPGPGPGAGRGP